MQHVFNEEIVNVRPLILTMPVNIVELSVNTANFLLVILVLLIKLPDQAVFKTLFQNIFIEFLDFIKLICYGLDTPINSHLKILSLTRQL